MYCLLLKVARLYVCVAVFLLLPRAFAADRILRVVDQKGAPVAKFDVEIYGGDNSRWAYWRAGKAGSLAVSDMMLSSPNEHVPSEPPKVSKQVFIVLVRADGYASTIAQFDGQERERLLRGEAKIVMWRGERVELRFRLPEGLVWPHDLLPDTYFDDLKDGVRTILSPGNRKGREPLDENMLGVRSNDHGAFELRLAPDKPFYVTIYSPGFLQHFEAGPFTLADAKEGVLEIELPRPASLDVRVDVANENVDVAPFGEFYLNVNPRKPGSLRKFMSGALEKGIFTTIRNSLDGFGARRV